MAAKKESDTCLVLLVEDNPDHAELLRRAFERGNDGDYELQHVSSYDEAVACVENGDIDVVLLDLGLPDIEFSDTLPKFSKQFPELPLIVLSSQDDADFVGKAISQGAQDYLVKSELHPALLMRTIKYSAERKRTELELERSNAELQRFASTIAHEIRSPLAVVLSCFSLLRRRYEDSFDEKTLRLLDETSHRTKEIGSLVTDLLEFAKFDPDMHFSKIHLNHLIDDVSERLQSKIARQKAKVTHDDLPNIDADKMLIRQLFHNLMSNALKYGGEGVQIHITCSDKDDCYVFGVKDTGPGIEEEFHQSIFDLFTRGVHTKNVSGTGIGLAFCKRIAEHHGGSIQLKSKVGEGSTFYVSLPKKPVLEGIEQPC